MSLLYIAALYGAHLEKRPGSQHRLPVKIKGSNTKLTKTKTSTVIPVWRDAYKTLTRRLNSVTGLGRYSLC